MKKKLKQESFEDGGDDMFTDPAIFTGEGMGAEMHSFGDGLGTNFGSNENFFE